jgi:small subunit ribosomal protein S36
MSWLRGDLRAAPLAVWAAVVLHLSLLLVQTTAQPPYRGLDEAAHVDMVLSLPDLTDWPAPGEKAIDDRLRATWDEAGYYYGPPSARLAREDAPLPRHGRPSFAEAGGTGLDRAQNQMVQHPPLYYALLSAATAAVADLERWPYDRHLALLRVLSALLLVPLPVLCWLAARRLELDRTAGVAAAFLPLLMPSVQRVAASVSNDGLLVLLFAAVNVLALAVAAGDLRRRTAAALGLLTAAALLTKGFALVLPVVAVAAYAVATLRVRSTRPVGAPALLATALTALGGWWYVRNLVLHGQVQPNGYRGGRLPYDPSPGEPVAGWAAEYVDAMLFRFWSSLGVPEPPALDERLSQSLTAGLLALALLAVAVARGRRLRVLLALLPLAGLLALVTTGSYLNHAEYGRMVGVQGRYLYPGLAGLCAAVALALARLSGPLRRAVPLALLAGAGVLQALAARAVLETWWTPAADPGALGAGLRTLAVWSPLPTDVVRALWAAPPVAAVAAVAASALLLRRDRSLPDAGAAPAALEGGAPARSDVELVQQDVAGADQ